MPSYFLTATGTDIGKTYIAAHLIRCAYVRGSDIKPLKPVMSGLDPNQLEKCDAGLLMAAARIPLTEGNLTAISPWRYPAPLAPDLAARMEGEKIIYSALLQFCRQSLLDDSSYIVEGAGGIMSPIAEGHTCLDLAADLRLPVLIVTGSYLGAVSHCLTALSSLRSRNCEIKAVIINQSPGSDLPRFSAHLGEFTGELPLFSISWPGTETEFLQLVEFLGF